MIQEQPNQINPTTTTTEGSQNLYRRPNKPKQKEVKPQEVLESVTNDAGEVFNPGDKISVKAPWGGIAIAEITGFYQDDSGNAWAHYSPSEPRDGWQWEGGCIRAALLAKAD
jgi:hypothetical protein